MSSNILSSPPQRTGRFDRFDAEERALGAYIAFPSARAEIERTVNAFDFEHECHREAFLALKRGAVTPFDLVSELCAHGKLDKLGVHVGGVVACLLGAARRSTVSSALDAVQELRAASE